MEYVAFIVHFRGGQRLTVSSRYREDREHEVDAAWDWIRDQYPDAEYIERF